MNRFLGLGAVFLMGITAWVGLSRQATQISAPASERPQTALPVKANAAKSKNPLDEKVGCDAVEDALQTFFLIDSTEINAPSYCFPDKKEPNLLTFSPGSWTRANSAHYVIALLPDPIHTHMAATFDQLTESIEHAAQAEGFTYDSSWLPWRDAEPPSLLLSENLEARAWRGNQEEQPGVVLFRNADSGRGDGNPYGNALVVFVVGEQATAGVNKKQFENAVEWIHQLGLKFAGDPLNILGPTSSGSFASLEDLLTNGTSLVKGGRNLRVVSGTVSAELDIKAFECAMGVSLVGNTVVTFSENTKLEIQRYLRLLAREGYDNRRVAVVSEDETVFGKDSNGTSRTISCIDDSSSCGPGLSLSYPRDIASLRSAYQKQGLLSPQGNSAEYANRQRLLSQNLDEKAEEADDTIQTYSGGLVDLSDESELLQLVQQLQLHQTQFVMLVSSNSQDQIFLARFLRASYPGVRIIILASDQLLFRERGAEGLRGVLTLSPYPLSPEVQTWTSNAPWTERPVFTTDLAQGVYYATRYLLRASAHGSDSGDFLPGFAAPKWMDKSPQARIPPTWLAVISAGRPWPIAALDERALDTFTGKPWPVAALNEWLSDFCKGILGTHHAPEDSGVLLTSPLALAQNVPPKLETSIQLPIEYQVAVILCFFWILVQIYLRRKASVIHKPRLRAYFSLTTWSQHSLVLSLSWACIGSVAISLVWSLRYASHVTVPSVDCWVSALILVLFICVGYPIYDWLWYRDDYPPTPKGAVAALLSAVVILSYIAILWTCTPRWNEATSVPELLRGIHLLSGVSPAAPFVLLSIGGYLWCLQNLHGLALFNNDQPQLPSAKQLRLDLAKSRCPNGDSPSLLPDRKSMLRMFAADDYEISDEYKKGKDWGLPLSKNVVWLFLAVLVVLSVAAWATQLRIRDLGIQSYGSIYGFAALISVTIMLVEACQLWHIWRAVHELLGFLDRVPLRRTIRGIRAFSWNSVWAMGGTVLECRYEMLSRQFESMRHLVNIWKKHKWGDAGVPCNAELQNALNNMETEMECNFGPWFASIYKHPDRIDLGPAQKMQERIKALTAALMLHVLIPAWHAEQKSLIVPYGNEEEGLNKSNDHGAHFLSQAQNDSPLVRTAEEFVCLNYLAFIHNMMGRIRTLITGTALLFVATAVSTSTYPFDPQPMLGVVFLGVFAVLAGSVIMVYAQAHRDATLSNITNTTPGALGGDFYVKVLQFALGPALGLVAVLFPSVANFLFTWLQPGQIK